MEYPEGMKKLIEYFAQLPTIGPKTAERIVLYLLTLDEKRLRQFGALLSSLKESIKKCSLCFNYSQTNPCRICSDPRRDPSIICVVAKPQDVYAIEKTHQYAGHYHVLGGVINPLEGKDHQYLTTQHLLKRIQQTKPQEIILAFNPDIEGETTLLSLKKLLSPYKIKITRLARGLPMGSDIEYADEITLTDALKGRRKF